MTETEYQRYWKRLQYGYSHDQAYSVPKGMPRWMFDIEQQEQRSIIDVVSQAFRAGSTIADIARSFGVSHSRIFHWVRKWRKEGLL